MFKFFDDKTELGVSVNGQLVEELHKQVSKKFKRRKIYVRFKYIIWAADLTEVELLSSKNKNVKHLLCVINVFSKYAWIKPLGDKRRKAVLNAFIEIANESNCKTNKLWVDQEKEFYNNIMREWPGNNDIIMNSTHNESKSVIAESFIKTLKVKIHKKWQIMIVNLTFLIWIS